MNASHHRHTSPLIVAFLVIGVTAILTSHNNYLGHRFHREILARIDPADVLTEADMIPERPAPAASRYGPITASVQ